MPRPTDPAMLGAPQFARVEGDFYPTPAEFTDCLLATVSLARHIVWEPACGEGHISRRLAGHCRGVKSSDLYPRGFGVPGIDFLQAKRLPSEVTAIVTNPPYGELAEQFIRHALELLRPASGFLAMFLRNEYDCAKERMDLFREHPFAGKIICTKRPRWIVGSKGSPRHNYAWYLWDWSRDPGADPTLSLIHPTEARPRPLALAA